MSDNRLRNVGYFDAVKQKALELLQNINNNSVTNNGDVVFVLTLLLTELELKADLTEVQPSGLYINKDGVSTEVLLDTIAPYATVPIPVALVDITGTTPVHVDIAGDLHVYMKHTADPVSGEYASTRIGDGTNEAGVTGDNELKVRDASSQYSNWDFIVGNSKTLNYYTGVAAGNPSGNTDNLESIEYLTGVTTIFTRTFAYDITDRLISITVS